MCFILFCLSLHDAAFARPLQFLAFHSARLMPRCLFSLQSHHTTVYLTLIELEHPENISFPNAGTSLKVQMQSPRGVLPRHINVRCLQTRHLWWHLELCQGVLQTLYLQLKHCILDFEHHILSHIVRKESIRLMWRFFESPVPDFGKNSNSLRDAFSFTRKKSYTEDTSKMQ